MDSNAQMRERVDWLMKRGVSQRHLAKRLGLPATTFHRWLNEKNLQLRTSALDALNDYIRELWTIKLVTLGETQRAADASSAERPFPASEKREAAGRARKR